MKLIFSRKGFDSSIGRAPLTYHADPRRWRREGDKVLLQSAGLGQEFVLDTSDYPEAMPWLHDLCLQSTFAEC